MTNPYDDLAEIEAHMRDEGMLPMDERSAVEVSYQDKKGAGCTYYPRTEADLIRRMKWLMQHHLRATVYVGSERVGAVLCMEHGLRRGGWTYWCDQDLFAEVAR